MSVQRCSGSGAGGCCWGTAQGQGWSQAGRVGGAGLVSLKQLCGLVVSDISLLNSKATGEGSTHAGRIRVGRDHLALLPLHPQPLNLPLPPQTCCSPWNSSLYQTVLISLTHMGSDWSLAIMWVLLSLTSPRTTETSYFSFQYWNIKQRFGLQLEEKPGLQK